MKRFNKLRFISILLMVILIIISIIPTMSMAAQSPVKVDLGTTESYAVLAGETITNTGPTTIGGSVGGNVGLYPGSDFAGVADVTIVSGAAIHINDSEAIQAKTDLQTAYDDAQGRTSASRIPTELGGQTLTPGVYDSDSGTFEITGTLTLDAQGDPEGVFIFKMESTLITAVGSRVVLTNSARFCRTFWQVGSSATLGTDSQFVGHIFALTSIAAEHGATVQGQLLALHGAVTLDNNTIINGICETITAPTETPTEAPTEAPTQTPDSGTPTQTPTRTPTQTPTRTPTQTPTRTPTQTPTVTPSGIPTVTPIVIPTVTPIATITPGGTSPVGEQPTGTPPVVIITETPLPPTQETPTTYPPLPIKTSETVTGGQIPETATPWNNLLFGGEALTLIGGIIGWSRRKH